MILHITTKENWENALINGQYTATSLKTEGFIHCSTLQQTAGTANLFFKGQQNLVLLCIDEKILTTACKYEDPLGGAGVKHDPRNDSLFPHVYGPVNNDAVIKVVDFPPDKTGIFKLPEEMEI